MQHRQFGMDLRLVGIIAKRSLELDGRLRVSLLVDKPLRFGDLLPRPLGWWFDRDGAFGFRRGRFDLGKRQMGP
jgi:hypothetical protein